MKKLINKYIVFIKYAMSSGFCFILDLALFTLFNYLFRSLGDSSIILGTVCARVISSLINYFLNRNKVFNNNEGKADAMSVIKYFTLVVIQMIVSSLSVMYLYKWCHINETLIKIPVDVVIFIVNFFVQKYFIFNKEINKPKSNIMLFIISIFTSVSLSFNPIMEKPFIDFTENTILSSILVLLLYWFYKKFYNSYDRKKSFKLISIIFSLLLVFGYSFNKVDSSYLTIGSYIYVLLSIVKFIGYYELINLSINMLFNYCGLLSVKDTFKNKYINKYITWFKSSPFITTFITLFIIYFIYLIAYFPGVVGYDPSYQIKEFFGIPNFYSEALNLDTSKTMITAFNPVLHTLLIGSLVKFGYNIGNVNVGIFIYTFIQMCSFIAVLSYSVKFLYEEKLPMKFILILIGLYIFVPYFPFYSICCFKDTYFSMFFMLFVIELCKVIKYKMDKKAIIRLVLVSFELCMFRNNGLITIIMTLLFFLLLKDNRKQVLISMIVVILLYFGYSKTLSLCGVSGTSIRETLSVPFQQTSALIYNKESVMDKEDLEVVGKLLDLDIIRNEYDPELSDKVKNTYNNNATNEELMDYFRVWFKYLIREPKIYIEATTNNIYGYFYPNAKKWYFYYKKYTVLNEVGIDYQYNGLKVMRNILSGYGTGFEYVPLIGLLVNIGANTWAYIYLIGALCERKNKKYILLLIPMISILLACMVGPVNTYFRYVLPYASTLPLILGFIYSNRK